jgi:hypothetical protein
MRQPQTAQRDLIGAWLRPGIQVCPLGWSGMLVDGGSGIVVIVGVDAHKRTHTLVAVDDLGRKLAERTVAATP